MRLERLRSGDEALYKEEIARTKDAISKRLSEGVDASEQMKWADTVSYNYNLSKAENMGISPENVAKDGYSARLFGDMTESVGKNTSTVSSPKKLTADKPYYKEQKNSSEALRDSVISSYVKGINERGNVLQEQAQKYISSVNADYEKQLSEVKAAYQKKKKNREEALLNEGASKGGGRVLSDDIRLEDEYRDLIKAMQNERDKLVADIWKQLTQDLYTLSGDMMNKASDEYYRYNSLLSEEKDREYQKSRDAVEDEKWFAELNYRKAKDKKDADEKARQAQYEREQDEYERSVTERELALRENEAQTDYEKWLKEFEADTANDNRQYALDSGRLALDREEFEYERSQDEEKDQKSAVKTYAELYDQCLEYAKKAKNAVKINATGSAYEPKYTRDELIKMVYGFKLTDEEKKSILYEIGVYK